MKVAKVENRGFHLVVVLTVFIAIFVVGCIEIADSLPFNQKVWLANSRSDQIGNPRLRMIEDLMNNHLTIGMNRQEVRQLLGKPDLEYNNVYSYNLGFDYIDTNSLYLEFDSKGKLVDIKPLQH